MSRSDLSGLTLQINCAACHGLLAWAERQGLVRHYQLASRFHVFPTNHLTQQQKTLLALTQWALECLGVSDASSNFWRGWVEDRQHPTHSRSWQLGRLCRVAPTVLAAAAANRRPSPQAAMYHCYEALLLNPDRRRSDGVDGHVDDRSGDLELSEAVYHHNFKQPLTALIDQILLQHSGTEALTIIDVGAGSGGMLLDIAEFVLTRRENVFFAAFDPSEVARQSCQLKAKAKPSVAMHVADGSIENPAHILRSLKARHIPIENCIVLAKSALHDRTLGNTSPTHSPLDSRQQTVDNIQEPADNYVYRDECWRRVNKEEVSEDMIAALNAWKRHMPAAKLIILESHVLPTRTIMEQIERIALLPAYLSHSLSAQYMLSANDHCKAIQQTNYRDQFFVPIQVMPDQNALMSATLLQG